MVGASLRLICHGVQPGCIPPPLLNCRRHFRRAAYQTAAPESLLAYENGRMDRVRIDKWLWAARFFKTRALAARACELGRIASNGQPAKPAREVRAGDLLQVRNDSGDYHLAVLLLSEMRGPAPLAQTLYRETEASRELRLKLAEERKTMPNFEAMREGRPSKRDRRQIGRLRGRV